MSENVFRTCASCENSGQPAQSHSLIRIFTGCILDSQGFKSLHADNEESDRRVYALANLILRWMHISEDTFSDVAVHIRLCHRSR